MRWKDVGLIALVLLALNVIRFWRGETLELIALGALFVLGYVVYRVRRRQWRRRADRLRALDAEDAKAQLAALSPEERAAMRISLGQAEPEEPLAVERVFHYPRTPALIREYTFWGSAVIAALAYLSIVFGWDAEERMYEIGLALFFTLSVGLQLILWDREQAAIRVTASGLQSIAPDGTVSGVLWREIALVRSRRFLNCVEFYSHDGKRRARVSFHLLHFAQFMELVVAHLRELEHRT